MSSFYGNIKNGTQVSLIFDKTYPNRYEMEHAIAQELEAGKTTGNINGDGVYNTRYVLINYGERRYSPYRRLPNINAWIGKKNNALALTDDCPPLYVYRFNGTTLRQNTADRIIDGGNGCMSQDQRTYGWYELYDKDNFKNESEASRPVFYISTNSLSSNNQNLVVPDLIDENCEYALNREIDEIYYSGSYDHTVWQKIWCSVKNNTTITEKYIMVANLDAQAPKMNIIVDAPDDNDEYTLVSKRYEDGTRVLLPMVGSYYELVGEHEITKEKIYEPLNLEYIVAWNDHSFNGIPEAQKVLDAALADKTKTKKVLTDEYNLSFDNDDNLNLSQYSLILATLQNQGDALKQSSGIDDNNNEYYIKKDKLAEAKTAFDNAVATYNKAVKDLKDACDKDYNSLEKKEIYTGPFFDYRECVSDIVAFEDLVDDTGNQIIKSKEILDSYIEHLGDIYRREFYAGENITDYEFLDQGSPYKMYSDNNHTIYHYYHKTFGEQGHITYELFAELALGSGLWYYDEDLRSIQRVLSTFDYNPDLVYYQRVPSDCNRGPHFDPLRSTDLDYKMHTPRNWKVDSETDFQYNKAGFNPAQQSYLKDKKNAVYFKKTSSGELYPVHMDTEGYLTLNHSITQEEAETSPQIPEAGYYIHNNLQYAEQLDTRKLDIDLSELGNAASQLWDLVYPRGSFEKVETPSYNDEDFINGNYYYKDDSNRYWQVGKGDILEPDKTYYVFKDAPADSTDAERYLFIGNDRDPSEEYPTTLAELIRYIYKVLGLETDNDYRDVPSQETIWGKFNGLSELLGSYDDEFDLEHYIPVRSDKTADVNGSTQERIYYGKQGDIRFGSILTEKMYDTLNNAAFGPLYVLKEEYPIWGEPVDQTKGFNSKLVYYIKKGYEDFERADITAFDDDIDYYVPTLLYEKSEGYDTETQYFRDVNSLWGLLREFQQIRENHQADWAENVPGSPSFIQNRPSVIYSKAEDIAEVSLNNSIPWIVDNEYSKILTIKSTSSLQNAVKALKASEWITCYYEDAQKVPRYELQTATSEYRNDATYYKIDKTHYETKSHNINDLWDSVFIYASDAQGYINQDDEAVTIKYLTYQDILDILDNSVYLLGGTSWYKGTKAQLKDIIQIRFYLNYNETGNELESWDASKGNDGSIMCYLEEVQDGGNTVKRLTISGGEKYIVHPSGFKCLPSNLLTDGGSLNNITGLNLLDTSQAGTMEGMFAGCKEVRALDIDEFNTLNVTSMKNMFATCQNLIDVNVSNFDTSNVTDMSGMFTGCLELEELDVSGFNTSKVTSMENMFNKCESLTTLDLGNFDTSNVTSMKSMFNGCQRLAYLSYCPNFNKVTDTSFMFYGCTGLSDINMIFYNSAPSVVTNMNHMFAGCHNLLNSSLPDFTKWNTSNVTDMQYMFAGTGVSADNTVLNLRSFNTSKVTKMNNMFQDSEFVELDLSEFDTSNVTSFTNMFDGMEYLVKITLGKNFKWPTTDASSYLPCNENEKWYDTSTNIGYTSAELASLARTGRATYERRSEEEA